MDDGEVDLAGRELQLVGRDAPQLAAALKIRSFPLLRLGVESIHKILLLANRDQAAVGLGGADDALCERWEHYLRGYRAGGGEVVGVGTPEDVAANPASHTGKYLKRLL